MLFDNIAYIQSLALQSGFTIFVLRADLMPKNENGLVIRPSEGKIKIEEVRRLIDFAKNKQMDNQLFFIYEAEKMSLEAENAILKLLEEPNDNLHLVFLTENLGGLLPTILSRAKVYFLREKMDFTKQPVAETEIVQLAKELVSARGKKLVEIAEKITKSKKNSTRGEVMKILAVAIEILYKTYFLTGNPVFLARLEKFLKLQQNISENGHIKLHLVADLC